MFIKIKCPYPNARKIFPLIPQISVKFTEKGSQRLQMAVAIDDFADLSG